MQLNTFESYVPWFFVVDDFRKEYHYYISALLFYFIVFTENNKTGAHFRSG